MRVKPYTRCVKSSMVHSSKIWRCRRTRMMSVGFHWDSAIGPGIWGNASIMQGGQTKKLRYAFKQQRGLGLGWGLFGSVRGLHAVSFWYTRDLCSQPYCQVSKCWFWTSKNISKSTGSFCVQDGSCFKDVLATRNYKVVAACGIQHVPRKQFARCWDCAQLILSSECED